MYLAVLQLYAVGYLLHIVSGEVLVEEHMVYLLLEELRVGQLRCQLAVIGKKEHACGVAVKTSDRVYALRAGVFHQIHDSLALLRIIACGHIILRLVEQHIHFLLERNRLVVEHDLVCAQHFRAEFGHNLAVYSHHTCLYEVVSLTTGAYAGVCEIFVEAYRFVRIYVRLLVLNTFLHAVLCVRVVAGGVLFAIAALLRACTEVVAVAALLTWLVALLSIARTETLLLARLIFTLLTRLVAFLLAWLVARLPVWLVSATLETVVGTVTSAIVAWTIARLLFFTVARVHAETRRTESGIILALYARTCYSRTLGTCLGVVFTVETSGRT